MRFHKVCSAALVSAALVFSTTNAAAASCQAGGAGCLLPFQSAPVAQPVMQTPAPVETVGVEPVVAETGGGIGILPILLGLAALGLLAFVLLDDDDDVVSA
jgi:hypothetical protein